jgi:hypothetical protein
MPASWDRWAGEREDGHVLLGRRSPTMPRCRRPLRRGEIIGEVVSPKPTSEADCFIKGPATGVSL